ncbi:MAG: hypothetical protein Q8R12_02600 [bacterium]|nr:hypothetical protein [bacterium]
MDNIPKPVLIAVIAVFIIAAGIGFWYWSQRKAPEPEGAVGTAKAVSELVPEIQTNLGEKVPEINPLDRANPFKYSNPLR